VTLYCDSKYVVEAMTQGWVQKWRAKEFLKKGRLMTNADLWKELLELCELHQVTFVWVKGHAGDVENERCDALSMAALLEKDLPEDAGYEEDVANDELPMANDEGGRTAHDSGKAEKIVAAGQACRKCGAAVEKRVPRKRGKGAYYYEWYLLCPGCGTMYMVEEAKRYS